MDDFSSLIIYFNDVGFERLQEEVFTPTHTPWHQITHPIENIPSYGHADELKIDK